MIFYFSGTGNSAWAARQLARLTGDEAYDITNLKELPDMENAKQIGFVFPVYAWGVPEIMADFAKKLPKPQVFTFGVCTCGGDAGWTMKHFSKLYPLRAAIAFSCPTTISLALTLMPKTRSSGNHRGPGGTGPDCPGLRRQVRVYRVHEGALAGSKVPPGQLWI